MTYETENIEFKSSFTEELYKEVIAFANVNGGVIYVGIDNEGNAVGLTNVDDEYTRITNGIRDAIAPDVTMFVRYTIQENKVVRITVQEGDHKPYYIKAKGMKPGGVYVRQGTSSVPASPEQIRRMIKESDGDVYEEMRSMDQELTFDAAEKAFKRYKTEFNASKYRVLGIIQDNDELYTNLAFILSDQCPYTVKAAVFSDVTNTVFNDSKEFGGSIFEQLDDAFSYLMICNKKRASFSGLERIEKSDYPEEALREALLNALVHRDYSYSGSIIININEQEIEFISIGGLVSGLSTDDIRSGISQPRNPKLAGVFHRLRLIESYGTGIRRIYTLYADHPVKPRIETTTNTFKIVLPNMNYAVSLPSPGKTNCEITEQMKTIIDYIEKNGSINDEQIEALLNIKKTRAYVLTAQMKEMLLIKSSGRGKTKVYSLYNDNGSEKK